MQLDRAQRDSTPSYEVDIRDGLMKAIARTVWLGNLTITDVARLMPNWRSKDLANVRAEKSSEFGVSKLAGAAEKLGVVSIPYFIPGEGHDRLKTEPHSPLFKTMRSAAESLRKAIPDIGPRSYPLARSAADTTSLSLYLAIEAIRREPYFWSREVGDFALAIVSTIRLLERIKHPAASVRSATQRLTEALDDLEAHADMHDRRTSRRSGETRPRLA